MINALAERFAEAFIRALQPKLSALVDDEIKRARAEWAKVPDNFMTYIP